jgi:hypothetical protein
VPHRRRPRLGVCQAGSRALPENQWKKGEKPRADALISEYGFERFLAAEKLYWQTQDPNSRTIFRWTAFLDGFQGWLAKITPAMLEAMANERWRKENPEDYKRRQDESVERQTRENMERKTTTPPVNETSIEDELGITPTVEPAKGLLQQHIAKAGK